MRLTTWNCGRGFAKKARYVFSASPDIVVIQECSRKAVETLGSEGYSGHWVGDNPNVGIAVFYRDGWRLRQLAEPKKSDPRWIVPFAVNGPENFTLIAVWACDVKGNRRESYVGQIHRAFSEYPDWFAHSPIVMAGDFNSNAIFDPNRRDWNHSAMVDMLRKRGVVSAYHALRRQAHGKEETPTFYLQKKLAKPFHLDYIFVPDSWRKRGMRLEIGGHTDWLLLSDHCPLMLEVSLDRVGSVAGARQYHSNR